MLMLASWDHHETSWMKTIMGYEGGCSTCPASESLGDSKHDEQARRLGKLNQFLL